MPLRLELIQSILNWQFDTTSSIMLNLNSPSFATLLQLPPRHSSVWKSRPVHAEPAAAIAWLPLPPPPPPPLFSIAPPPPPIIIPSNNVFEPAGDDVESKLTPMHDRRRIRMQSAVHVVHSDQPDQRTPMCVFGMCVCKLLKRCYYDFSNGKFLIIQYA